MRAAIQDSTRRLSLPHVRPRSRCSRYSCPAACAVVQPRAIAMHHMVQGGFCVRPGFAATSFPAFIHQKLERP
jgi:hypothetical protein